MKGKGFVDDVGVAPVVVATDPTRTCSHTYLHSIEDTFALNQIPYTLLAHCLRGLHKHRHNPHFSSSPEIPGPFRGTGEREFSKGGAVLED